MLSMLMILIGRHVPRGQGPEEQLQGDIRERHTIITLVSPGNVQAVLCIVSINGSHTQTKDGIHKQTLDDGLTGNHYKQRPCIFQDTLIL